MPHRYAQLFLIGFTLGLVVGGPIIYTVWHSPMVMVPILMIGLIAVALSVPPRLDPVIRAKERRERRRRRKLAVNCTDRRDDE